MRKLGLYLEKASECLVDIETGEIVAETQSKINEYLTECQETYTLQLI